MCLTFWKQGIIMGYKLTFDEDIAKILYEFGQHLIYDDRGDLGFTSYYGRSDHKYNGVVRTDHPSALHHYHIGTILVLVSQLMALTATGLSMKEAYEEIKNEGENESESS